jgi:hypothetical protein
MTCWRAPPAVGLQTIDASIHRAYISLVRNAKRYLYLENQYFLGSSHLWERYGVLGGTMVLCVFGVHFGRADGGWGWEGAMVLCRASLNTFKCKLDLKVGFRGEMSVGTQLHSFQTNRLQS